jgi:hypothetical protein
MASRTRLDPAALAVALAGALVVAWMGLREFAFSDYELEALPSFTALAHGDVGGFFAAMPVYGGSLVIRAPFALLPDLWGGGSLAVYRSVAVPGLLAGVWLGLVLDRRMRKAGERLAARRVALLVCAASPVSVLALQIGHPEEILGAGLCVGAILLAARDHALLAGLLLGLALANKAWAVLAVVPVLLALPRRRGLALVVAGGVAAAIVVPVLKLMDAPANFLLTNTSEIFQPWQVWWFAGDTGQVVQGFYGVKPDYRAAPEWMSTLARPAVLAVCVGLALAWAWTGRRRPRFPDVLLLLAVVMLARCLVDPWNTSYYHLPFLFALVTWEVHARRGVPLLALTATLATWATFDLLPRYVAPDVQSLSYLAWAAPLAVALGLRLFAPTRFARLADPVSSRLRARLPTLGALVRP